MDINDIEARILVLAPAGRDAALLGNVLSQVGLISAPCQGSGDLHDKLRAGAGAVLLTEEALSAQITTALRGIIAAQPTWSDLPLVLLVGHARQNLEVLGREANMTVLERPTSISTLMTVVRAALRARRRQYQVRDLLAQEEAANEQLERQVVTRTAELQASHREIAAEHQRVSAILASISDAFAALDENDRVIYLNPKGAELATQLTNRVIEDLLGKTVWELFPESEQGSLAETYRHVVSGGVPASIETFALPLRAWLELRVYPTTEGVTVYAQDITERKQSEEELMQAVQEVMTDTAWFSRSLLEKLAQIRATKNGARQGAEVAELTKRERQVLERIAKGYDNSHIASELSLAEQTVRNYITNIYDKLGVHSRASAIIWARERGLAPF